MTELLTPTRNETIPADADSPLREQALEQLKKKRDFRAHLLAYVLFNTFLWLIWAVILTAADGPWFPWPLFPLVGWGIGLIFHALDTYGHNRITEAEIGREIERLRRQGHPRTFAGRNQIRREGP